MGQRLYDPAAVDTVQGHIARLDTVQARRGPAHRGVHVQMVAGLDTVMVHLGPLFYLRQQKIDLAVGETMTVRGARAVVRGQPVLIAAGVEACGESWTLRDAQGRPAWRGQRRQP
jgi:hypothetical protein